MNTTFDKTRFVKLLKWEMMTGRKDYMRFAIGIALTHNLLVLRHHNLIIF